MRKVNKKKNESERRTRTPRQMNTSKHSRRDRNRSQT